MIDGTCAVCGAPALDPDDPANREVIHAGRSRRRKQTLIEIFSGLFAVAFVAAPFVLSAFTKDADVIAFAPLALLLAVVVVAAIAVSRHRPAVPGARLRFWTSATVISAVVCVVFVAVKREVGIEKLWFGAGYFAEPWRIVTASFTHGGAAHIGGNMIALALFGPAIDLRVGRSRTTLILAAGAIAGACAQALYSDEPMVGFSAAIFGLFGATLALMPRRPQRLTIQMVSIPMPTWAWMIVTVPLYTLLALSDKTTHVAWVAHLGGFAAGFALALPMRRVPESADFVAHEQARATHFASLAQHDQVRLDDLVSDEAAPAAAAGAAAPELDPEIAAFQRSTRRRQVAAVAIGGVAMLVFGLAAAGLGAWMDAPAMAKGRQIGVIAAGLMMTLVGGKLLHEAIRLSRRQRG